MSNKRDYYEVLGLNKSSSDEDIKKSYRKLAMKFHPDRVAHMSDSEKKVAEDKFKELQEAYAVLSDPQKKQMYDQFGHAAVGGNSASGGAGGFGGFQSGGGFEDIFEAFGDIFGGRGGSGRGRASSNGSVRGNDLEYQIEITLEESAFGVEKQVTFPRTEKCSSCGGSGAKKGSEVITCNTCKGQGQVRFSQGFFSVQQACPDCRGSGKTIKDPCYECHGVGLVKEKRSVKVNVPAGVEEGSTLRLTGEGEAGLNGGVNGDLYVHIRIRTHNVFTRQSKDLHCEVPISLIKATLGGEVDVPTIEGKLVKLKVPEGTQSGSVLRIKDKGIKSLRGVTHGDLYCHIIVETPVKLTDKQKDLLQQLAVEIGEDDNRHYPKGKSFIDKIKQVFSN